MKLTKHKRVNKRKTRKMRHQIKKNKKGGDIHPNELYNNVKSIGFEIETIDLIKLTLTNDKGKDILVNSSLVNADLEQGLNTDEYIYVVNNSGIETFKITNDIAKDTLFNIDLKKKYEKFLKNQEDEEEEEEEEEELKGGDNSDEETVNTIDDAYDCDDPVLKLIVSRNRFLKQKEYNIKFKDENFELNGKYKNCRQFSDTEYIATYYRPNTSSNIIKDYLFKTLNTLNNHLRSLAIINANLEVKNDNGNFETVENLNNMLYILPNSNLLYFSSTNYKSNYNIINDLTLMFQMTFSCNVEYIYDIMINLHNLDWIGKYKNYILNDSFKQFFNENKKNKNLMNMLDNIKKYKDEKHYEIIDIKASYDITEKLVNNCIKNLSTINVTDLKKIKMYLFLIIYKIYIYLNDYIKNKQLLKKWLVYVVRHDNATLYNKIIEILKKNVGSEQEVEKVIVCLLDYNILNELYKTEYIKEKRINDNIESQIATIQKTKNENYGDPFYSIKFYFDYLNSEKEDWFIVSGVDEGSTKFELNNDDIIVEFRGFPEYLYTEIFFTSDDIIKKQLIKEQIGLFAIGTLNQYMESQKTL